MPRFRALLPAFLLLAFALPAAAQSISGVVTSDSGTPLPHVTAAAYPANGTEIAATTDTNGYYSISVAPGTYHVLAYDPAGNFATGFNADAPSFDESPATVLGAGQSAVVNLVLHLGGKVTGTVLPASGAIQPVVAAYNLSGTRRGFTSPDSSGAYSLVLPPGGYKIAAYDDRGAFAPSFFDQKQTFASANTVPVAAAQTTSSVSFNLQIGAQARGAVTTRTGSPIANVIVLAYNAAGVQIAFTTTGADGQFAMTVLPGTYRFVAVDPSFVYAAGFLSDANSFELSPALQLNSGSVRQDLSFHLDRGGEVTGSVDDAATGAGIRNITVAAYNTDGTQRTFVTTDANGKYVLLLPPGDFRIAAFDTSLVYATQFHPQSTNFAHATATVPIPGQTVTLQPFTLSHGGRFSGKVSDQNSGIGGATVGVYDLQGNLITNATTAQDGTYRLVVPPGSYRLIAFDPQFRYAPAYAGGVVTFGAIAPVSVATDDEQAISFTLQRGTLLNGTAVDRAHAPVSDIVVTALDLNQNPVANAISGSDGSFRFALVPGQYKFFAFDPGGRFAEVYMGGTSFASAAIVTVDAAGAPRITVTVASLPKRRAVSH